MEKGLLFLLALLLCNLTQALYTSSDDVIILDPSNFDKLVKRSDDVWLVEFYAPWCGHCKALTPEWKKAANALKGVIKVGAVDMDAHPNLGQPYGITGFPTIKFFGLDKANPDTYQSQRQAKDIVDYALRQAKSVVRTRLGGKSRSSSAGGSSGDNVIELTSSNFQELVLNSNDIWLVEFFAPWCGHCKNLKPHWDDAADQLQGKVKLGAVDATVYQGLAQQYAVQGYPTIKVFPSGHKSEPEDYTSGRTASDIVRFATELYKKSAVAPEVRQLLSGDQFETTCKGLCVVTFLPDILDTQAVGRNAYIDILKEVAEKFKMSSFNYVWAPAFDHSKLEEALEIGGAGYPALAIMHTEKQRYAKYTGGFAVQGISDFLDSALRKRTIEFKMPTLKDREPWDGKDGELPEEEDWDLYD